MIASYFPEQHTLERLRNQPNSLQGDIEWPNVVVEATYKKFQKYVPESAFSIFSNNKGKSRMNVHQRTLNVCEQTFYITNPFESFEFEINSESENRVDSENPQTPLPGKQKQNGFSLNKKK